ncbi:MAG: transposase, partial [Patulibacter sp.]|nr:transposase [Patulibacter sp.]
CPLRGTTDQMSPTGAADPDEATVRLLVDRLRAARQSNGGRLPHGWIDEICDSTGLGRSTLLRYLAQGAPRPAGDRRRWRWDDTTIPFYFRAAGDVTFARRLIADELGEHLVPSVKTMYRAAQRDLTEADRALAQRGERAGRGARLVCAVEEPHRNATWLADHKQLDLDVLLPRGTRPTLVWMTVIVDGYSRRVVGAALGVQPNQGHVLSALAMGVRQCGVPSAFVFDNGLEFLADAIREMGVVLGFATLATPAYRPDLKGKVERLHTTLNRRLAQRFVTVTHPATNTKGGPLLHRPAVPLDLVRRTFFEELEHYNDAPHRSLGNTPRQAYADDATPERRVDPAVLRRFALTATARTVGEHGIRFGGRVYWAPELLLNRGRRYEVRYAQDDQRQLEIYDHDRHRCTATVWDPADPVQQAEVISHRQAIEAEQRQRLRMARKQGRQRWRAMTAEQTAQESTVVTRADHEAARTTQRAGSSRELLALLDDLGMTTDLHLTHKS